MPDAMMPKCLVRTYSGQLLDLLDPSSITFDLEDIVTPLSRICRFAGQTQEFYSVAEHSVMVSYLAEEMGGDAWQALWHDAAEALVGDVTSPLKVQLPKFKRIEDGLLAQMGRQFGFDFPFSYITHRADKVMVQLEGEQLMRGWVSDLTPSFREQVKSVQVLGCLSPAMAAKLFLNRADSLRNARSLQQKGR
jgi:hypothetical protein